MKIRTRVSDGEFGSDVAGVVPTTESNKASA
jgi:hypothetical protein